MWLVRWHGCGFAVPSRLIRHTLLDYCARPGYPAGVGGGEGVRAVGMAWGIGGLEVGGGRGKVYERGIKGLGGNGGMEVGREGYREQSQECSTI